MSQYDDLAKLVDAADRFATIVLPAPSSHEDAGHRLELSWRAARRQLSAGWEETELAELDSTVADLHHGQGESLVLIHPRGGPTLIEFLSDATDGPAVIEGPVPSLVRLIAARQHTVPHVVVHTDRAGAQITAYDGGQVVGREAVDGDTEHIHRGHPGGWSQRRFQQRAENTWERNAGDVAEVVADVARQVDARLVAVAGDVRAQGFVVDALPHDVAACAAKVEAGSPEGIAEEVERLLATAAAAGDAALADDLRTALANGRAVVDTAQTVQALVEGRVSTLLVHDDGTGEPRSDDHPGLPPGARMVDAAVVAALRTDAEVVVVPALAALEGPIGAFLRW